LANWTDAQEQRRALCRPWTKSSGAYGERYPLDEDFLPRLPRCAGQRVAWVSTGLVMLASGAAKIDQVVWTPPAGSMSSSIAASIRHCATLELVAHGFAPAADLPD